MNSRLILWSATSALAGFLFGFDTVVISGAEKTIQELWSLNPYQHGLAMSMALWGTVVGSFVGAWPTDKFGRKATLLWIGILYFVSAVWSALANDPYSFMVARFIGGLGVGISTVAAPLYISEISPPAMRGRLAGMFQFNIVFGILVAFLSNYLLGRIGENAWRWMLGVEAIPALIYSAMCISLPESPRWLLGRNRTDEGMAVLKHINSAATESELEVLVGEIQNAGKEGASRSGFWSKRLMTPIALAFLIAMFNQLSGINAILYFAPRIFGLTGLSDQAALLQSVGIGLTNLVFTFVGLYLIDRLGRRTLLLIGSFGYIISLGLVAWAFFMYAVPFNVASQAIALSEACDKKMAGEGIDAESLTNALKEFSAATSVEGYVRTTAEMSPDTPVETLKQLATVEQENAASASGIGGMVVLICIFGFIAAHAVGQGAVIWVFISEIFPNRYRASGQSLGSFTHWIFAALLTTIFPYLVTTFPPGFVFAFFCAMMFIQLLWVTFMVPETKGIPLEEIERHLGVRE